MFLKIAKLSLDCKPFDLFDLPDRKRVSLMISKALAHPDRTFSGCSSFILAKSVETATKPTTKL